MGWAPEVLALVQALSWLLVAGRCCYEIAVGASYQLRFKARAHVGVRHG